MSNIKTFIPDEIIAGFQKHDGVKSGKLSFLSYKDEKGKLKFETSFNNWIDKSIPTENYKNDIFNNLYVGNTAGGCKSGWNYRQEYIQLTDNRGLTFEIPTYQFLTLLDYSVCDHGVLTGNFVFAWCNNDLKVISTEDPLYEKIKEHSNKCKQELITKVSQMVPGKVYKLKNSPYMQKKTTYYFIGNLSTIKTDLNSTQSRLVFSNGKSFFFSDIKNVEYADNSVKALTEDKLSEIINAFEHSPYSKKWWKEYRFNSTLTQKNLNKFVWREYYRDNIYNTNVDENGNIITRYLTKEHIYTWGAGIYLHNNLSINDKNNHKTIRWFNILKDDKINIPIQYKRTSSWSCSYPEIACSCTTLEYLIIKQTKDPYKIHKNFPGIKKFINERVYDDHFHFKSYCSECDGYEFNLTEFLYDGFIFETNGNFSVNELYTLPIKQLK